MRSGIQLQSVKNLRKNLIIISRVNLKKLGILCIKKNTQLNRSTEQEDLQSTEIFRVRNTNNFLQHKLLRVQYSVEYSFLLDQLVPTISWEGWQWISNRVNSNHTQKNSVRKMDWSTCLRCRINLMSHKIKLESLWKVICSKLLDQEWNTIATRLNLLPRNPFRDATGSTHYCPEIWKYRFVSIKITLTIATKAL